MPDMATVGEREVARLLNESDPVAQELAKVVCAWVKDTLQDKYNTRQALKVLIRHWPDELIAVL
jgi:hypothetical protein